MATPQGRHSFSALGSVTEVAAIHPHRLLLLGDIVAHQGNGTLVVRFTGQTEQCPLFADQLGKTFDDEGENWIVCEVKYSSIWSHG